MFSYKFLKALRGKTASQHYRSFSILNSGDSVMFCINIFHGKPTPSGIIAKKKLNIYLIWLGSSQGSSSIK